MRWRLKCDTEVRNKYLKDVRTGKSVAVYDGNSLDIEVGLFTNDVAEVDATAIKAAFIDSAGVNQLEVEVAGSDITKENWDNGSAENASINFTDANIATLVPGLYTFNIHAASSVAQSVFASGLVEVLDPLT